jgi:sporulation protein YlmC with PRC-barrel domain
MCKAFRSATAVAAVAGVLLAAPPQPAFSQGVEIVAVDVKTVGRGYRASKLKGAQVTNDKNEKIGEVDDLVIGRDKVLFAILEVGGFLGVGKRLIAVPYESLVLDETGRKIQLPGASREALRKLAEFKYLT